MIADILYDLNLFVDGHSYAGRIKELKLPIIKPKLMGYQAGGMAAEVDVPMGRFEKVRDRLAADKMGKTDAEKEIALIAMLAEVAPETLHELDMADYGALQ